MCDHQHLRGYRFLPVIPVFTFTLVTDRRNGASNNHLQNIGFLYVGNNLWRLSPAFDLNPFQDKDRESKTWLSEDTGPITSLEQLFGQAARFSLKPQDAVQVVAEVVRAVTRWREVAVMPEVGLTPTELDDLEPAFDHQDLRDAVALVATT